MVRIQINNSGASGTTNQAAGGATSLLPPAPGWAGQQGGEASPFPENLNASLDGSFNASQSFASAQANASMTQANASVRSPNPQQQSLRLTGEHLLSPTTRSRSPQAGPSSPTGATPGGATSPKYRWNPYANSEINESPPGPRAGGGGGLENDGSFALSLTQQPVGGTPQSPRTRGGSGVGFGQLPEPVMLIPNSQSSNNQGGGPTTSSLFPEHETLPQPALMEQQHHVLLQHSQPPQYVQQQQQYGFANAQQQQQQQQQQINAAGNQQYQQQAQQEVMASFGAAGTAPFILQPQQQQQPQQHQQQQQNMAFSNQLNSGEFTNQMATSNNFPQHQQEEHHQQQQQHFAQQPANINTNTVHFEMVGTLGGHQLFQQAQPQQQQQYQQYQQQEQQQQQYHQQQQQQQQYPQPHATQFSSQFPEHQHQQQFHLQPQNQQQQPQNQQQQQQQQSHNGGGVGKNKNKKGKGGGGGSVVGAPFIIDGQQQAVVPPAASAPGPNANSFSSNRKGGAKSNSSNNFANQNNNQFPGDVGRQSVARLPAPEYDLLLSESDREIAVHATHDPLVSGLVGAPGEKSIDSAITDGHVEEPSILSPPTPINDTTASSTNNKVESSPALVDGPPTRMTKDVVSRLYSMINDLRHLRKDNSVLPVLQSEYSPQQRTDLLFLLLHSPALVLELCVKERGNVVVQLVEAMGGSPRCEAMIRTAIMPKAQALVTSQSGCLAFSRIYEVSARVLQREQAELLLRDVSDFLCYSLHPFGNYAIQRVITMSFPEDLEKLKNLFLLQSAPALALEASDEHTGTETPEASIADSGAGSAGSAGKRERHKRKKEEARLKAAMAKGKDPLITDSPLITEVQPTGKHPPGFLPLTPASEIPSTAALLTCQGLLIKEMVKNKFGSHVFETYLITCQWADFTEVMLDGVLCSTEMIQVFTQDKFANYVLQSAIRRTWDDVQFKEVCSERIKHHLSSSPFAQNIVRSWTRRQNPTPNRNHGSGHHGEQPYYTDPQRYIHRGGSNHNQQQPPPPPPVSDHSRAPPPPPVQFLNTSNQIGNSGGGGFGSMGSFPSFGNASMGSSGSTNHGSGSVAPPYGAGGGSSSMQNQF